MRGIHNDRGRRIAVLNFPGPHEVALILFETTDAERAVYRQNGRPHQVVAINCVDIESAYRQLQAHGVQVEALSGPGDARYFCFDDIDWNRLEAAWSIWD